MNSLLLFSSSVSPFFIKPTFSLAFVSRYRFAHRCHRVTPSSSSPSIITTRTGTRLYTTGLASTATTPSLPSSLTNTFCVLRHGQSLANVDGLISSSPQVAPFQHGLSPMGKTQAQKAAQDVVTLLSPSSTQQQQQQQYKQLILLTSDFLRAKETAEIVAQQVLRSQPSKLVLQDQPIIETRLRERWFGDWDAGSDKHYPDVWKDDVIDPAHTQRGVEPVTSVLQRTVDCVLDWDAKTTKQQQEDDPSLIILVAHGDVLQILQTAFARMDCAQHRSLPHLETATLRKLELKPI